MNPNAPSPVFSLRDGDEARLRKACDDGDARVALRARIVLASARGLSAEAIGEELSVAPVTVYKWRSRYRAAGIDGLHDLPRSGQPRKLSRARIAEIVEWTVERLPERHVRWSVRKLARAAKVTEHQIRTIWAEHDLRPHASAQSGPLGDGTLDGVDVELYGVFLAPPLNLAVLGVRETRGPFARTDVYRRRWRGGQRMTDLRHGPESLFSAHDRATRRGPDGEVDRDRNAELESYLSSIDGVPEGTQLHLIASCPRAADAIKRHLRRRGLVQVHAMPTAAAWACELESWMCAKESRLRWSGELTRVPELRAALRDYIEGTALGAGRPFAWRLGLPLTQRELLQPHHGHA
jgi:transposase